MGKGEIARYEQFLLFPQCFQKACFTGALKGVIVWEWVNYVFDMVEITGGNGKNACFSKASKGVIVWEWVKACRRLKRILVNQNDPARPNLLVTWRKESLENTVRKGEMLFTRNVSFSHNVF